MQFHHNCPFEVHENISKAEFGQNRFVAHSNFELTEFFADFAAGFYLVFRLSFGTALLLNEVSEKSRKT